ncbi:MAG TPA: 1,2-phenylacetyl-CoA epoxidase subunit PaaD [Cyclobacteriaceae bacterium]|nr:1,2-phenylacetyl-CoA epoxidase subunit PaaD [Cyclobacteriaceae bacterium]
MKISVDQIYNYLEEVKDPEIPVLSLVDLGVITEVTIDGSRVKIEMTPTFVGCPALDIMKADILTVLEKHGIGEVRIDVTFRKAWTSDRISEKGKAALKEFGLAPPPPSMIFTQLEVLESAQCPRCDGTNTELKTPFGATLCRAIYYCRDCKDAFEQFKPL